MWGIKKDLGGGVRYTAVPVSPISEVARQASCDVDARQQGMSRVSAGAANIEIDEGSSAVIGFVPAPVNESSNAVRDVVVSGR